MKEVQPRLMTTRDTAIYLSVSEAALKAWRVRGGGPPWIKVGHAVRYDLQRGLLRQWRQDADKPLGKHRLAGSGWHPHVYAYSITNAIVAPMSK